MAIDYTPDGNTVFVGGWDRNLNRVYCIEGLRAARFKQRKFGQNKLDVRLIETFQNVVIGTSVDPDDEIRLLITCGNYGFL